MRIKLLLSKGNSLLHSAAAAKAFLLYDCILSLSKLALFCYSGFLFFLLDSILHGCVAVLMALRVFERKHAKAQYGVIALGWIVVTVGVLILCFANDPLHNPRIGQYTSFIVAVMAVGTLASILLKIIQFVTIKSKCSYVQQLQLLLEICCTLIELTLTRATILSMTSPESVSAMSYVTAILAGIGTIAIGFLIILSVCNGRKCRRYIRRKHE